MHVSRTIWIVGMAVAALGSTGAARGANVLPQGNLADICPVPDERDTIASVRSGLARRLGAPIKEEAIGTLYVLTYKQRDGSQLSVTLTRENDKLEATCDTAQP